MLYPRVIEVVRASRAGSAPPSGAPLAATAAVIRARARLEPAGRRRPAPGRHSASA